MLAPPEAVGVGVKGIVAVALGLMVALGLGAGLEGTLANGVALEPVVPPPQPARSPATSTTAPSRQAARKEGRPTRESYARSQGTPPATGRAIEAGTRRPHRHAMDRSAAPPAPADEIALCLLIGVALFAGLVVEPLMLLVPTVGIVALGLLARLVDAATPRRRQRQNQPSAISHLTARGSPAR
jgi:hypothetical protein